jgi:uroporphyrinogen decarboxylase
MSPRENFYAMMEGGNPMRLPFDLQTTEPVEQEIITLTGKSSIDFFDSDFRTIGVSFVGDDPDRWRSAYKNIGFHVPADAEVLRMGITFATPPAASLGQAFHLREMLHPLAEADDVETLEQLPWPNLVNPESFAGLRDQCMQIQALGKVATASLECTIFEDTWYLRGMDNVFCDWADEGPVTEWLLDFFTERSARAGAEFARAGFDLIRLGDDVGTQNALMMSLETWRRHLKPRLSRVIAAIRKAAGERKVWIQYHSDGNVTDLIDDLVEIGIDILNPVQPECMNLEEVCAHHRHHVAFSGMIGTQTTMPFGTSADVIAAVDRCRALHKEGARVIVAPTHVLEPDVPWENLIAFCEAVRA